MQFPSHRAMIARIRSCLKKASSADQRLGRRWYFDAFYLAQELTERYQLRDIYSGAGIIAALSPGVRWEINVQDARNLCELGSKAVVSTYNANKQKALAIRFGADPDVVLGGLKVRAFWLNIARPDFSEEVCIDRWAIRAIRWEGWITDKRYRLIAKAYRHVADRCGLLPHQVQAIVWTQIRESEA